MTGRRPLWFGLIERVGAPRLRSRNVETPGRGTARRAPTRNASEMHFQPKLDLSRVTGAGDLSKIPRAHPRGDPVERWMVEDVKEFRPELVIESLRNLPVLVKGEIPVSHARPPHAVPPAG